MAVVIMVIMLVMMTVQFSLFTPVYNIDTIMVMWE